MDQIIYSAWMGPGQMSRNRENALLTMVRNNGCANAHITAETLVNWVHPEYPLHPLFGLLSAVHKCDYLRCYLLHVYGGGYSDVKPTAKNWRPLFDLLQDPDVFGLGYTEVSPQGIAAVGGELELEMKRNYQKIVGVCAMIFKPNTFFTSAWYEELITLIEKHSEALRQNPARHPQDHLGAKFSDGTISRYPFRWTEVGGDIFHPLAYKYSNQILHCDISPSFENYR
jgi:hypothetical protein